MEWGIGLGVWYIELGFFSMHTATHSPLKLQEAIDQVGQGYYSDEAGHPAPVDLLNEERVNSVLSNLQTFAHIHIVGVSNCFLFSKDEF